MIEFCMRCRGRMCPPGGCILKQQLKLNVDLKNNFKKEFSGENYNIFVGKFGYPNINVGLLNIADTKKDESVDNPILWSKDNYEINQIIRLRSGLINSNFKTGIKDFNDRYLELAKELSLSKNPVDTEVVLEKTPVFKLNLNSETTPHGPTIKLEKARITENVKIPPAVDKIANEDLSASESLSILYDKGYDEHYLTKVFSVGNFGRSTAKKLVPTRWSITAVDDTLGRDMIKDVKNFNLCNYQIYFGGYLGNYYMVMFFAEVWSYELFETMVRTKEVWHDYEEYFGRKEYASVTAGGYYAARFSILQKLSSIKKQGTVLALRFVTDEYWAPLGVWVVREAVKKAMNAIPIDFNSREEMLKYAHKLAHEKFGYDIDSLLKQSVLLKTVNVQKKIFEY